MGAFAQFERDLIRQRQREGIALARLREEAHVGRKHSLKPAEAKELCRRVALGESKTKLPENTASVDRHFAGMSQDQGDEDSSPAGYELPLRQREGDSTRNVCNLSHAQASGGMHFGGLRELVLKRDGYRCRVCVTSGRDKRSIIVHHRKPGGSVLNLILSLCPGCHAKVYRTKATLSSCRHSVGTLARTGPEGA